MFMYYFYNYQNNFSQKHIIKLYRYLIICTFDLFNTYPLAFNSFFIFISKMNFFVFLLKIILLQFIYIVHYKFKI